MRTLVLPPSWDAGGAERVALELASARAEAGDSVALAAPAGTLDATPLPAGVERAVLPAGGRGPVAAARGVGAVARLVRRSRPELVHAHNPRATAGAWLAAALSGRQRPAVVATYHGVAEADRRGAARVLARCDEIVCVSRDLRDELERAGLPAGRARVVANGVTAVPPLTDERTRELRGELGVHGPLVTLVGRLVEQKAPERFVDAACGVAERRPDVTFLVVGDGPLRPELEGRAAANGAGSRIRFTGVRSDARELIALSDLLVFTSVWEGLSIAALEAMSAGVPVVATNVSGMRELLGSGAGRIVDEPVPHAFARAIEELLADAAARAEMGERGRALVDDLYSVSAMAAGYDAVYRSALAGRR